MSSDMVVWYIGPFFCKDIGCVRQLGGVYATDIGCFNKVVTWF